jgi:hypothetical protein
MKSRYYYSADPRRKTHETWRVADRLIVKSIGSA